MAMQHYKGELGEFDYDDNEFEVDYHRGIHYQSLRYIAHETDGSKIHIPNGIVDCNHMFADCESLEIPPVIPDSVEDCTSMFLNCISLEFAPNIPDGVKKCAAMFSSCKSLYWVPAVPVGVTDDRFMFECCSERTQERGDWNIEHRGHDYMKEVLLPKIDRGSLSAYRQHKQTAVERAAQDKNTEANIDVNNASVESDATQQVETEVQENDVSMEISCE